ncbi:MAG: hypothetical protein ACOC1F_03060 [Myxococcota bacterium]
MAAAVAPGCRPKRPAATAATSVGQGERFEAGTPVYDEYFATVHELHSAVATAELEERDACTSLATMLHLLPTASAEQVLRKLRERTDELPRMRLVIDAAGEHDEDQHAKIELLDGARPEDDVRNLIMIMEATARADLDLAARMAELPERSHRMHSVGKALIDGTDKEFADQSPQRRQRIRRELEASLDVLVLVANAAREVEKRARAFVAGMQDALTDTEDNEPAQASSPGPVGQPPPPPKPRMPDDFNP